MRAVALAALMALGCSDTGSPRLEGDGDPPALPSSGLVEGPGYVRFDTYFFGPGMTGRSRHGIVHLTPADLTSGSRPDPWIYLEAVDLGLGEEDVPALAARYQLVTWPERQEVPTDALFRGVHTSSDGTRSLRVMLRPRESLKSPDWYAIRGTGPVSELAPPDVNPRDGDPAVVVSRFHVGPSAIVRRVFARTTSRATAIQIWYTQRVLARPESYEVSSDGVVEPRCRLHNVSEMEEPGSTSARILCPPLPWASLVVRHVEPVIGAGGTAVTSADGTPIEEVDLAFGVGEGDGSYRREVIPIVHEGEVVTLVSSFGLEDVASP